MTAPTPDPADGSSPVSRRAASATVRSGPAVPGGPHGTAGGTTSPQPCRERAAAGIPGPETAPSPPLLGQAPVRARSKTPAPATRTTHLDRADIPGRVPGNTPAGGESDADGSIPIGICECGCGKKVPIPRFIQGHEESESQLRKRAESQLRKFTARFWGRVDRRGPDECWPWTGPTTKGYGFATWRGRSIRAHRIAYTLAFGSDPGALSVDHLCHNRDAECPGGVTCGHRSCCNPAHLEAVTDTVNKMRGKGPCAVNAAKEKCIYGHEFDEANTRIRKNGHRACRKCEAARTVARNAVRSSARAAARHAKATKGELAA